MPDDLCPHQHDDHSPCDTCTLLETARGQERAKFTATWKQNLPYIERRNYARGWQDALTQAAHNRP